MAGLFGAGKSIEGETYRSSSFCIPLLVDGVAFVCDVAMTSDVLDCRDGGQEPPGGLGRSVISAATRSASLKIPVFNGKMPVF